ncbi:hypothetical protein F4861DRAFT_526358 [Xylaria intraflava]|nr:hypothetical protein F4861DRAFT_526358 [Xylaria intraflava]
MAEPTNTPMPTAPPTRSSSPAPPLPTSSSPITTRILHWNQSHSHSHSHSHSLSHSHSQPHSRAPSLNVPLHTPPSKPLVLLLGDTVQHNTETHAEFISHFEIVRPSAEERTRLAFTTALRTKKWGYFAAVVRLSRSTGGEMGNWDAELIALLPDSVRVFASTESESPTDVKALGEKGVVYYDAGLAAAEATADFATAQIISTFRALPYCISLASTLPLATQPTPREALRPRNLRGQVLGLVGFRDVGEQIARRCAALGMQILYHDFENKSEVAGSLRARYMPSLEALVHASDCVVLCDPTSADRVFDRECLRWFKRGARLVSIAAQTALVDQDALADALEAGWLAGVALDVQWITVGERLGKFTGSTALLTCSDAWDTQDQISRPQEDCMRNVLAVLKGDEAE